MNAIYLHKNPVFIYLVFAYWIGRFLSYIYEFKGAKFIWFDIWVGLYYDEKNKVLYYNPFPCIVFKYQKV